MNFSFCRPFFRRVLFLQIAFFSLPIAYTYGVEPPNVVLIISDDQAWTDYGFMGHPVIQTPHLDQLSRQSVLFRRGYVPTALCRPSLMTLATGHFAHRHGVTGNDPSPKYANKNSKLYQQLSPVRPPYCGQCGFPFDGEAFQPFKCHNCRGIRFHFESARSVWIVNALMQDLLHRFKYQGALWLLPLFAPRLCQAL
ncbi:sulfatase-like hydrolase/transferase, partial [Verrucomicrobia bacterium]|nr:sulfatase-like hydrolase/transferase [Verrucomicrobiota bacterium]